jgi:hypothetical protein
MENTTSTIDKPAISYSAAHLSLASGVAAIVLLAALHILSPEFDPSWRMVSEYALGQHDLVLSIMFVSWALSSIALFFALGSKIQTVGGKIGLGFLLLSALGTGMAAIFDIRHSLHGLAFITGVPSLPVAALLISRSLLRDSSWTSVRRSLLWTANLTWISVVLMLVMMFTGLSQSGGEFGPSVLVGWPNRFLVLAYCSWLVSAARGVVQVDLTSG